MRMHRHTANRRRGAIIWILSLAVAAGCASGRDESPDLRILYERSAQYHKPDRNPIIVIPGILGSKLVDSETGQRVWGAFEPGAVDPSVAEGARLISLPIDDSAPLSELQDSVRSDGVLDKVRVKILGIPVDIRAYAGILSALGVGGYRDEALGLGAIDYGEDHFTCFQFDYDWRRDNVENAKRLKAFIDERRAYIQDRYLELYGIENAEVRFDIVAHSMGGLVGRYYLRYGDADLPDDGSTPDLTWAGAEDVERLILVGTPNAGSLNAFTQLVDGYDVGRPILPFYQAALLGTFPTIYQLLPRPRHGSIVFDDGEPVDIYDPLVWEDFEWGLASRAERDVKFLRAALPEAEDDEERRTEALGLQETILDRALAFHEALDAPASPPPGTEIFLVAGDAAETPETIVVDRETGAYRITERGLGDGTVLRSSALMDERVGGVWGPTLESPIDWASVMFIFADHLGLTQAPSFTDNVLYWLLEDPRRETRLVSSLD